MADGRFRLFGVELESSTSFYGARGRYRRVNVESLCGAQGGGVAPGLPGRAAQRRASLPARGGKAKRKGVGREPPRPRNAWCLCLRNHILRSYRIDVCPNIYCNDGNYIQTRVPIRCSRHHIDDHIHTVFMIRDASMQSPDGRTQQKSHEGAPHARTQPGDLHTWRGWWLPTPRPHLPPLPRVPM